MKKNKIEKRVVNIEKTDFDKIKEFCDEKSYNTCKFIANITLKEIDKLNNLHDIKRKVWVLVGEASTCWNPMPDGVFDTTRAIRISDDLIKLITEYKSSL